MKVKFRAGPTSKAFAAPTAFAGFDGRKKRSGKRPSAKSVLNRYVRFASKEIRAGDCAGGLKVFETLKRTPPLRGKTKTLNTIKKKFIRKCLRSKP